MGIAGTDSGDHRQTSVHGRVPLRCNEEFRPKRCRPGLARRIDDECRVLRARDVQPHRSRQADYEVPRFQAAGVSSADRLRLPS